ncbi:hypothetical protein D3C77_628620 [compost metagenome]
MPNIHIQRHNITETTNKVIDQRSTDLSLFSGIEILYGLRSWYEHRVEIVLDGYVLSPSHDGSNHTVESILKQAVVWLEMDSTYNARTELHSDGTLLRIVFAKT